MTDLGRMSSPKTTVLILLEGGEPKGHATGHVGWSGFLRYWGQAGEYLRALGYQVVIGTLRDPGPLQDFASRRGWPTFDLGARSSAGYPLAAVRLRRLIISYAVDLVHANESIQAAVGGAASAIAGVPVIFHRHHTTAQNRLGWFTRVANRFCDLTMAVSEAVASSALAEGVKRDKVVIAHNGTAPFPDEQPGDRNRVREEIGAPDDLPLVGVIGHLRPEKGHLTLINATARAAARLGQTIGVVVVGTGPAQALLEGHAGSIPGIRAFFVGHQEDVHRYFFAVDVVAVPSYQESFGLVALEALACRKAVVASDVEGLRELIEHETSGLLVPAQNEDLLAQALWRCLTDPSLANYLGRNGFLRYQKLFTLEAMVDGWTAAYERVLRSRR